MSHSKPTPVLTPAGRKICPVCGKSSYSREGIHPQCAIEQSDAPRKERLAAARKLAAAKKTSPPRKPARQVSWTRKCPKCHGDVHVRRKVCACGHQFDQG